MDFQELELVLILPMIVVTLTTMAVMLLVAWRRHHAMSCILTVAGLLVTMLAAVGLMSGDGGQFTPLVVVDRFALFFTAITAASAISVALFAYPYLRRLADQVE